MKINMQDLEKAKQRLKENNLTLSIVKNGKILFETASNRISGFLKAYEKLGDTLKDASIADKVVGRAIALLCVQANVKEVHATILSESAKTIFDNYAVQHEWDILVENILDTNGEDICPFEKLAKEIADPEDAYGKLKALQDSLKRQRDEGK
jgi:protein subunit release factor A